MVEAAEAEAASIEEVEVCIEAVACAEPVEACTVEAVDAETSVEQEDPMVDLVVLLEFPGAIEDLMVVEAVDLIV